MANNLKTENQIAIVSALVEGASIRSVERMTGVHRDTIMRLGVRVGQECHATMNRWMKDLDCQRIQFDEIWGFVGKKKKNKAAGETGVGDAWTFVALDADTKLVPVFRVGKRDAETANAFVADVASRLKNRVQISTDSLHAYVEAIEKGFGGEVDYGQIVKVYSTPEGGTQSRYSPGNVKAVRKAVMTGKPDMKEISTSYIERQNLTMRMSCRRLTRLTNAFSKKMENFHAAVALHFGYYNFVRIHSSLGTTPAKAAGVTKEEWTIGQLVEMATVTS